MGDWTHRVADHAGFGYLFMAVDIFPKFIHCIPIEDKPHAESIRAFADVLHVIGVPTQIMSDGEGAWEPAGFIKLLSVFNNCFIVI